jgi:dTDP-4-dehydrorhamnose 3,5-epimerase
MPFTFSPAALPGVVIIEPSPVLDARGFLMETYKKSAFLAAGVDVAFVQENHSRSIRGTLRGLHLQGAPRAQAKLVRVTEGTVFEVVADVRQQSPTFRQWVSVTLSADNRRSLFIPAGYAHGFCVISAGADVLYKMSEEYAPDLELGIRWDDPMLAIDWPIRTPLLSERDRKWPGLVDCAFPP